MSAAGRVTAVAVATVLAGASVGFAEGSIVVAWGNNEYGPCDVPGDVAAGQRREMSCSPCFPIG